MDTKEFHTVGVCKDGKTEDVVIHYGTLRGNTTWFAKNKGSVSCKVEMSKKGIFSYGSGKFKCTLHDKNVTDYIAKDYK